MVATSVCARGLDIASLMLVINFKCPTHLEDYIHRIGRTGRAGNQGTAITFMTRADESFSPELLGCIKSSKISEVTHVYKERFLQPQNIWRMNFWPKSRREMLKFIIIEILLDPGLNLMKKKARKERYLNSLNIGRKKGYEKTI